MDVEVREATVADAAEVARLVRGLAALLGERATLTDAYARDYLERSGGHVLLAEIGSRPAGLLCYSMRQDLFHGADCCLVEDLVVLPEFQRQGVGSRLFERLKELTRPGPGRRPCAEISVSTEKDNAAAIAFYRKQGLTDEYLLLEQHLVADPAGGA